MRKIVSILLALMLLLTGTALAETTDAAADVSWTLTIRVMDADGAAMPGLNIRVRAADTTEAFTGVTDDTGAASVLLPEGVYTVRATDPADGYATEDSVGLYEDTELPLTLRKLVAGSKVTVGSMTKVNGQFFTDMFGNNTSDIDVRAMLHGYATVAFTSDASYAVDEAVATVTVAAADGAGNKLYVFQLAEDLTWNDGTPITASDYVFSVLLRSAPQTRALGAATSAYASIMGYTAFQAGTTNVFSGVRLIDDRTFSLTIAGNALPYYYELTYVNVEPCPMSVIAPGCSIADDGAGAYITSAFDDAGNPTATFSTEMLQSTLLGEDGYCMKPMLTCGPYSLVSYDAAKGEVVMTANIAYKGNYEGQRPLIEQVTLVPTTNATALDELESGVLDVVNKAADSTVITDGTARVGGNLMQSANYLRSGQGFLGFACEQGPTASERVRQAVSYCLDQDAFVTAFTGNYGLAVYSYYGLGQWMAADYVNTMQDELTTYPMDIDAAVKLLEKDGWTLNAEGKRFTAGTDTVRYQQLKGKALKTYEAQTDRIVEAIEVNGKTLLPLSLHFALVEGSTMGQMVVEQLIPNLQTAGFEVITETVKFEDMLQCYYRQTARTYNMFAFATNFTFVFDPIYTFSPDDAYQGAQNTSGISDTKLRDLAQKLRGTTPGDVATYTTRWLALMKRYSDILPTVPIYSNVYFDFFAMDVQDYAPNGHWSWPAAILYTWRGEAPAVADDALILE